MHVSLYVADIHKTAEFYNRFFDCMPTKLMDDYCKFELDAPALIISFVQNADKVSQQFGHLGIQVDSKEELDQRLAATKNKGLALTEEMGTNCCYAEQDKYWVADPDGYMWEVYFFHKDVAFNDPRHTGFEAKPKVQLTDLTSSSEGATCAPGSGCC